MANQFQDPLDERGRSPAHRQYEEARRLMDEDAWEQAVDLLHQSARESPHFKTYELLGECHLRLGRFAEAIPCLAAATSLNRGVRAPALLAEAWLKLGRLADATEAAEIALTRDPANKAALQIRQQAAGIAKNAGPIVPVKDQIQALVDLETEGWNIKNPDHFLDMIHPDMVWPWPPTAHAHDPVHWVFVLGRFNRERWRKTWQDIFDTYDLVHNRRVTIRIEVSAEQDGAFAVVDIDTLWRHKVTRKDFHWQGRVCKIFTRMANETWKFYYQTGALDYSGMNA